MKFLFGGGYGESPLSGNKLLDRTLYSACKLTDKHTPRLGSRGKTGKEIRKRLLEVELHFDADACRNGFAILQCRLVFIILKRLQSRPTQRRRPRQHSYGGNVALCVYDRVDYDASGLEVVQIIQGRNRSL